MIGLSAAGGALVFSGWLLNYQLGASVLGTGVLLGDVILDVEPWSDDLVHLTLGSATGDDQIVTVSVGRLDDRDLGFEREGSGKVDLEENSTYTITLPRAETSGTITKPNGETEDLKVRSSGTIRGRAQIRESWGHAWIRIRLSENKVVRIRLQDKT